MTGIYIMLGGIVLFATIVGIYDIVTRRQHRRERERRHSA